MPRRSLLNIIRGSNYFCCPELNLIQGNSHRSR
jgi:hypothetical protein